MIAKDNEEVLERMLASTISLLSRNSASAPPILDLPRVQVLHWYSEGSGLDASNAPEELLTTINQPDFYLDHVSVDRIGTTLLSEQASDDDQACFGDLFVFFEQLNMLMDAEGYREPMILRLDCPSLKKLESYLEIVSHTTRS